MAEKARFQLNLDPMLMETLKRQAERADISVTKLISGVLIWATDRLHHGRPYTDGSGDCLHVTSVPECVWFSQDPDDPRDPRPPVEHRVVFALDFTGRGAVMDLGDLVPPELR